MIDRGLKRTRQSMLKEDMQCRIAKARRMIKNSGPFPKLRIAEPMIPEFFRMREDKDGP